jgi:putative methyltransferase (TIGR04325 family)
MNTATFQDFPSALEACEGGYNATDIADVIAYKTAIPVDPRRFAPEQAVNTILSVCIAASETNDRPLNVVDFGGGCGFHYHRATQATRTPLRWAIIETSIMADRANKVAQGRFKVFTALSDAIDALGRVDLVHVSGAVQYTPDPMATTMLADIRAKYFALLRFPVWNGAQTTVIQESALSGNGIGPMPPSIADRKIRVPLTFINFDDAMGTLADYEIVLSLESPSTGAYFENRPVPGVSLLLRLAAT